MSREHPARVRAAPARLEHEQVEDYDMAALLSQIQQSAAALDGGGEFHDDNDDGDDGEVVHERKESEARAPARVWSQEYEHHEKVLFQPPRLRRLPPAEATSALDFFSLLFTPDFLQHIVSLTNEYARERCAVPARDDDEQAKQEEDGEAATGWVDTSVEEVRALLGCLIYMSVVQMDATEDYWAAATQQPFVTTAFPRSRFYAVLRNLRVNAPEDPDSEADSDDRLAIGKLRQLLNMMEGNMLRYY